MGRPWRGFGARHAEESLSLSPPSEPRQSVDEQARNRDHHSSDPCGQDRKQHKVSQKRRLPRLGPPLAAIAMCGGRLNVQKIALTAIVDQTDNFTTRADPRPSQAACAANSVGSLLEADAPPEVSQEGGVD